MSTSYNNATSTQQPAAICALKSPADAILILEAVKANLVPRVTRRLTGHERSMIRPGTVWVWEEEETNMRRWTDGRRWGASRVGGGGFLVYTESSESLSPPPSQGMNPYNPDFYQQPRKNESLIKQTYSTSMKTSSGKPKRFHVVAYSSKFNPQGEAHNPLPLPHQLPLLADIKIQPSNWPEWEQQRSTTEAYARRPPPGVTLSPSNNASSSAVPAPHVVDGTPGNAYPTRLPTPPSSRDMYQTPTAATAAGPGTGAYPDTSYLARDPYDRRNQPYAQQPYPSDRYQTYSMGPVTPTDPWYGNGSRRERSPPIRGDQGGNMNNGNNSNYLQTPYGYYPRDRYAETSPSYMPYGGTIDYRSPEIRMYESVDQKPSLLPQPTMTRLPLTPNSANPDLPAGNGNGTGPSPKLSINNTLLNPSELNANGQMGNATGPGLTLPPLRMTLDDGGSANGGINGHGRKSPNGSMLPKEDAQQLDGLGRRAY